MKNFRFSIVTILFISFTADLQANSDLRTSSEPPEYSEEARQGCLHSLAQVSGRIALAPFRTVAWPFRTKKRALISLATIGGFVAFVWPYNSREGKSSPAMNTFYLVRDYFDSSEDNSAQLNALEILRSPTTSHKTGDSK